MLVVMKWWFCCNWIFFVIGVGVIGVGYVVINYVLGKF